MPTQPNDYWFIVKEDRMLLVQDPEGLRIPQASMIAELLPNLTHSHHIGTFEQHICYCGELNIETHLSADLEWISLRRTLESLPLSWSQVITKAYSIIKWDRNHLYCGHCAQPTVHKPGAFERICQNCGLMFYPRISPSVIVLIQRGDEILMARSPHFTKGSYGLLAGFVEVGESLEAAAHREVREEVNIEITNLQYFGSQPWPFPDSLMVGFIADYASGEIVMDKTEIEDAGWYHYKNLPYRTASSISIARRLVDYFVSQRGKTHE